MQNAPNPKTPSNTKKIVALSLATCILLGIVGFEVVREVSNQKKPAKITSNFSPFEVNNRNLQLELNQTLSNLNEMKRLLFVKSSAPESSTVRKIKLELAAKEDAINALNALIEKHELHLEDEKTKITTLESSLSALTELLDIQKNAKQQVESSLADSIAKSKEETLAEVSREINTLKQRVLTELEEKQSLLSTLEVHAELYNGSIRYGAELQDELAIETALRTIQNVNFKSALTNLEDLKIEAEFTRFKLENETSLRDEAYAKLESLDQKWQEIPKQMQEIGLKGANLEEELAFEMTAHAIQKKRLQTELDNVSKASKEWEAKYAELNNTENPDLEQILLFERLENKLAQERLNIELEDLSYGLISTVQQYDLARKNLDDHLAIFADEKQENEQQIKKLSLEVSKEREEKLQLLSQIASLHELNDSDSSAINDIKQKQEAYIGSLENSLKEAEEELLLASRKLLALSEETSNKHLTLEAELNTHKESLSKSAQTELHLAQDLESALNELGILNVQIAHLEEMLKDQDSSLVSWSASHKQMQEEAIALAGTKQTHEEYIASLELALKNQNESRELQIKQELQQSESQIQALNDQIKELEIALNQQKALVASEKLDGASIAEDLQKHEEYIASLENALKDAEKELKSTAVLLESYTSLESEISSHAAVRQKNEEYIASLENALKDAEKELKSTAVLLESYTSLETEISSHASIRQKNEEYIASLEHTLKAIEEEASEKTVFEEQLKQDLETALNETKQLNEQINHLQETLASKENSFQGFEVEAAFLAKDKQMHLEQIALFEQTLKALEEEAAHKSALEVQLKQDLEIALSEAKIKKEHEAYIVSLEQALLNAEKELNTSALLLENLGEKTESEQKLASTRESQLKQELETARNVMQEHEEHIASLEYSLKSIGEEVAGNMKLEHQLQQDLAAALNETNHLNGQIEHLQDLLKNRGNQTEAETVSFENALKALEQEVAHKAAIESQLKLDLETALNEATHLKNALDQVAEEAIALSFSKQKHENYIASLVEEASHNMTLEQQLKQDLATALNETNHLNGQIEHLQDLLKNRNNQTDAEIVSFENALKALEDELAHKAAIESQLKLDLEMALNQANNLSEQSTSLANSKQKHEEYIASLEHALQNAEGALNQSAALLETLEHEVASKTAALDSKHREAFAQKEEALLAEVAKMSEELTRVRAFLEQEQRLNHENFMIAEQEKASLKDQLHYLSEILENQSKETAELPTSEN